MKKFFNAGSDYHLDDIVFENRNKAYGAYALRREENYVLTKSFFIGIIFCITVAATPVIYKLLTPRQSVSKITADPHVLVPVPVFPEDPNPVAPATAQGNKVLTINTAVPTPKKEVIEETPSPSVSQYDGAQAGLENLDGVNPTVPNVIIPSVPPTDPSITVVPEVKPADPNEIVKTVDVKADFTGGIEHFRALVSRNMDVSDFEDSGIRITSTVTFIVERDGSISSVSATGKDNRFNKEAQKAVKSVKGRWSAAKFNGLAVRSYFSIPITIQFE